VGFVRDPFFPFSSSPLHRTDPMWADYLEKNMASAIPFSSFPFLLSVFSSPAEPRALLRDRTVFFFFFFSSSRARSAVSLLFFFLVPCAGLTATGQLGLAYREEIFFFFPFFDSPDEGMPTWNNRLAAFFFPQLICQSLKSSASSFFSRRPGTVKTPPWFLRLSWVSPPTDIALKSSRSPAFFFPCELYAEAQKKLFFFS